MRHSDCTCIARSSSVPVTPTRCPRCDAALAADASTSSIDAERFRRNPDFQLRALGAPAPVVSVRRKADPSRSRHPVSVTGAFVAGASSSDRTSVVFTGVSVASGTTDVVDTGFTMLSVVADVPSTTSFGELTAESGCGADIVVVLSVATVAVWSGVDSRATSIAAAAIEITRRTAPVAIAPSTPADFFEPAGFFERTDFVDRGDFAERSDFFERIDVLPESGSDTYRTLLSKQGARAGCSGRIRVTDVMACSCRPRTGGGRPAASRRRSFS